MGKHQIGRTSSHRRRQRLLRRIGRRLKRNVTNVRGKEDIARSLSHYIRRRRKKQR
jgi:hypothetical protein